MTHTATCDSDPVLTEENVEIVNLETCSHVYFAGYLAQNCSKRFKCEQCLKRQCDINSTLNDRKELLILNRTFSNVKPDPSCGLKAPSSAFMSVVTVALETYKRLFNRVAHKKKLNLQTDESNRT